MKKVIKGKVYNTQTATKLAGTWHGKSYDDFNFEEQILYQTKKGALFLYKSGGANSSMGNGSMWGENITAYDSVDAIDWLMQAHESGEIIADTYIEVAQKLGKKAPIEA